MSPSSMGIPMKAPPTPDSASRARSGMRVAQRPSTMPTAISLCLALIAGGCTWTVYDAFDHGVFDLQAAVVAPLLSTLDARMEHHAAATGGAMQPPVVTTARIGS